MVRVGILLYGLYRSEEVIHSIEVQPVMKFKTKVSAVKTVPPGTPIGYGKTFIANKESIVATLPVGYGDGYRRQLANRGEVLIRGYRVPVIGHICMDMCMVDASDVEDVQVGDNVVLFGEGISVNEFAARSDTNIDEVLCGVEKRVPRVYTKS
ncbi:Alanine racemase 1 [subsurface metagenome]